MAIPAGQDVLESGEPDWSNTDPAQHARACVTWHDSPGSFYRNERCWEACDVSGNVTVDYWESCRNGNETYQEACGQAQDTLSMRNAAATQPGLRLSPADSPPRPDDTSSSILDQIKGGKGDIGLLRDMPQHDSDFTNIDSLDEESAGELLRTLLIDEDDIEYIEEEGELPESHPQNDRTERFEERRTTSHSAVTNEEQPASTAGQTDGPRDNAPASAAANDDAGQAQEAPSVEMTIESSPAGATVSDGSERLGTTPLTRRFSADAWPRTLWFEKEEYRAENVELEGPPDGAVVVELEPEKTVETTKSREEQQPRTRKPRTNSQSWNERPADKPRTDKPDKDESSKDVDMVLDKYLD